MRIAKGQEFTVKDKRKGTYRGVALRDFDTETEEFYPVTTLQHVRGMSNDWEPGEVIPCRRGLAVIVLEKTLKEAANV